ncbi:hypothetical protein [Streptomyces sp. TE33382]
MASRRPGDPRRSPTEAGRRPVSKEQLRTFVEEDYESAANFDEKARLAEELHTFMSRMRPGDTLCTVSDGRLHIGEITGSVVQRVAEDGSSNLRRPVEWGR